VVVWITGFSGAGKTTLAHAVRKRLSSAGIHPLLLDGDEVRAVLGAESGVFHEERKRLARIYSRLARLLSDQGFLVIVATISMFKGHEKTSLDSIKNSFKTFQKRVLLLY
jgi:adenylylsulfate kinase